MIHSSNLFCDRFVEHSICPVKPRCEAETDPDIASQETCIPDLNLGGEAKNVYDYFFEVLMRLQKNIW